MPRSSFIVTACPCAVALLLDSGCAGDAATRYRGRVLAGPAASWRADHDAVDPQPPVAKALVSLAVTSNRDPATYCASLAASDRKRAGSVPDAVWTREDGSFDVVTYYGGLWPLPMPDHTYLCVDHPDYEPFVYTARPPDPASNGDTVLKLYLKPRSR